MNLTRAFLSVVAGAILVVTSCGGLGHSRKRCEPEDASPCRSGEECLWVHDGDNSGYFCARTCSQASACPDGESCKAGGASGCMTCQDLVDICE
jgi:hypothetical protein